jgi:hypothetical protein
MAPSIDLGRRGDQSGASQLVSAARERVWSYVSNRRLHLQLSES